MHPSSVISSPNLIFITVSQAGLISRYSLLVSGGPRVPPEPPPASTGTIIYICLKDSKRCYAASIELFSSIYQPRWNSETRSRLHRQSILRETQNSLRKLGQKETYLKAALIKARWLKACGVFPNCSPLRDISSENMLR